MTTSETDRTTIRIIIFCAVSVAVLCLCAGVSLVYMFRNATGDNAILISAGGLLAVPSSCVTGLFGLLAKTSTTKTGDTGQPVSTPVTVTNGPSNPASVTENNAPTPSTAPAPVSEAGAVNIPTPAVDPQKAI